MIAIYALLGLVVGALLNLCADLLPQKPGRFWRPSCPYCGQPRPPWAWISTLAYVRSKPECLYCSAPISWRRPLVELGMAALFAFLWQHYGPTLPLLLSSTCASVLVLIAIVDLDHRLIPNAVIYPAWGLALLGSLAHPAPRFTRSALPGGVVGFGVLFLVHLLGKLFVRIATRAEARPTRRVAFGLGDVRLGGLAGLILGFPQVLLALLLAVLLGGVAALVCSLVQAINLRRFACFAPMPYTPYVVAGTMVTMFFGPEIGRWLPKG